MSDRELLDHKLESEFEAAEARLEAMHADAKAREAKEEMDAIVNLRTLRDTVRTELSSLRTLAITRFEEARVTANLAMRELDDAIDRMSERYARWDAAREKHFEARLDEAQARLREWRARAEKEGAELLLMGEDSLAILEEDVALGRARLAEWRRARHERKAEEALREAAKHFDEAYDAAKRHG